MMMKKVKMLLSKAFGKGGDTFNNLNKEYSLPDLDSLSDNKKFCPYTGAHF